MADPTITRALASAARKGLYETSGGPTERLALRDAAAGGAVLALARYALLLEEALAATAAADRTPFYAPGEALPGGEPPAEGERWATPAEIAASALAPAGSTAP
ncbi:hypothetical protein SAMN06265365_1697 [Tistlia consotensis]|uniref:Uncharacterized protein n=1 Tax=Tistlia consotensis USBA 355 TaxID=560819 RepID=A0A1Y6CSQ6_9PROT|nr:hypothetical protein [Tistlia consotensis]SMF85905.1 hypothetical protein SAMN05428998_1742 [Tistlia consotensis USBA 355]SNS40607.1 hypothetical protein SAMN06265365_1697 [Tistlia consotensis]